MGITCTEGKGKVTYMYHAMGVLVHNPQISKPRGFGFCEYKDPQTASSAVRNLAGQEVNGRPLRIDSATNAPGGEGSKGPPPPVGGGQSEVRW